MSSRFLNILFFVAVFAALFGCDTVRYRLQGHAYILENGLKAPASNAKVILKCPNLLSADKETKADSEGFYTLDGKGALQDCILSVESLEGKSSSALSTKDIIDQTYPLSPKYRKDLLIEKKDRNH